MGIKSRKLFCKILQKRRKGSKQTVDACNHGRYWKKDTGDTFYNSFKPDRFCQKDIFYNVFQKAKQIFYKKKWGICVKSSHVHRGNCKYNIPKAGIFFGRIIFQISEVTSGAESTMASIKIERNTNAVQILRKIRKLLVVTSWASLQNVFRRDILFLKYAFVFCNVLSSIISTVLVNVSYDCRYFLC